MTRSEALVRLTEAALRGPLSPAPRDEHNNPMTPTRIGQLAADMALGAFDQLGVELPNEEPPTASAWKP